MTAKRFIIDNKISLDDKIDTYRLGKAMSVNFDEDVDRIARLSELQQLKKELSE